MQYRTLLKGILTACLINTSLMSLFIPVKAIPPVITAQAGNKQLNEQQISAIIKEIEKAYQDRNVAGISKFLAPFATANVFYKSNQKTSTYDFIGKREIVNFLESTFKKIQERKVIKQNVNIKMAEDGQLAMATVRTTKEVTTTDGKHYYSSSLDVINFATIDNQPMIVFVKTEGWVSERTIQK